LTPDNLAGTSPAAGDNATSTARVETSRITVGLLVTLVTIELGVIESTASVTCQPGPGGLRPVFAGSSTIANLKINGLPVTIGSGPVTIPLVVGSLKLNGTTITGNSVTQQAVVLDTVLTDLVIGEAKANVEGTPEHPAGNPCQV